MRLFLVAAIPLVLSVLVQVSIGLNKIKVIALAALVGSAVNLPVSCYLTARLGVSGVIWGTVLTTLFSNLLVPGIYVFRELQIDLANFLTRTLSAPLCGAGRSGCVDMGFAKRSVPVSYPGTSLLVAIDAAVGHLTVGTLAYIAGYLLTAVGQPRRGRALRQAAGAAECLTRLRSHIRVISGTGGGCFFGQGLAR